MSSETTASTEATAATATAATPLDPASSSSSNQSKHYFTITEKNPAGQLYTMIYKTLNAAQIAQEDGKVHSDLPIVHIIDTNGTYTIKSTAPTPNSVVAKGGRTRRNKKVQRKSKTQRKHKSKRK